MLISSYFIYTWLIFGHLKLIGRFLFFLVITFHDFAEDRHPKPIYDGNASTDYETIGVRLMIQKRSESAILSCMLQYVYTGKYCSVFTQENARYQLLIV